MLSIFKKKKKATIVDLSSIGTDMHSHLLPGIDDGAGNTDESLELIRGLQALGYKKLVTTPHVMGDIYKNDVQTIQAAHQQLQQALQAAGMTVDIRPAAEYMLDDHFDFLLQNDAPLLTIKDKWVLVEFSFVTPPMNVKEKLFDLQIKGYQPILAHPERYLYFKADKNWYDELKNAGCHFQVNLLSLGGYYGKGPQELAQYLVKKNYVDLLGTDCHHTRHIEALHASGHIMGTVQSLLDADRLLNPSL